MNSYLKEFFLNEYVEEKRIERALLKLDMAETFNIAYVGSQPPEKGKSNKYAKELKEWRDKLWKEVFGKEEYEKIKLEKAKEEAKKTWGDLRKNKKGKKKVMF
jgi:hypothetical protein